MDAAAVKEFFDQVASEWDDMRVPFYNERVIDALAEHSALDASATVIDVGTGTGFVAAGLAPRVGHVVGVDHSRPMLSMARNNLDSLAAGNSTFVEGAVDQLPIGDGCSDAAVANMVLHHAPDPSAMLREMARVVRPGGWIAITDEVQHPYEWMRAEQGDIWLGFTEMEIAAFFDDARLVEYGYASLGMQ